MTTGYLAGLLGGSNSYGYDSWLTGTTFPGTISPLSTQYIQQSLGVSYNDMQRIMKDSLAEYKERKPESFNKKYMQNDNHVGYEPDNDILYRLRSETREFCKDVRLT